MHLTTNPGPRMRVSQSRACSWHLLLQGTGVCLLARPNSLTHAGSPPQAHHSCLQSQEWEPCPKVREPIRVRGQSCPTRPRSGPDLDAEPELLVGHLQAPRVVLQLPGLLQVLLHPPDVVDRGLEDGAFVPAHVPAAVGRAESRCLPTGVAACLPLSCFQTRSDPT